MSKNWADDDASSDGGSDAGGKNISHVNSSGGEVYNHSRDYSQQSARDNMSSRPTRQATSEKDVPTKGPFIAYVGNLPFSATENMVGNFFEGGGCGVKDVMMKFGEDGRPRGFANVEFFDRESLCKALTANGEVMGGRSIRVDVDMKRPPRNDHASGDRREGGRDRERDGGRRGYREGDVGGRDDRPVKDEPEGMWNRAAARREPPLPPRANKRSGKEERDKADGTISDAATAASPTATPPAPPATRPMIKIQPRTLPVEAVGLLSSAPNQSIFGGGKAHDEKAYEVCRPFAFVPRETHILTFCGFYPFLNSRYAGGAKEEGRGGSHCGRRQSRCASFRAVR